MIHLEPETIARLVEESPSSEEALHLRQCAACAEELEALTEQKRLLSSLPSIPPPVEDWDALEARLQSAGLIESGGTTVGRLGRPRRGLPWWGQAAAAVVLVAGGVWAGRAQAPEAPQGSVLMMDEGSLALLSAASVGPASLPSSAEIVTLEETEELVRLTRQWHQSALLLYGSRLERSGAAPQTEDPIGRLLALESVVMATEAAMREAPTDPFLNGIHVSAVAERQAALDRLSSNFADLR